MQICKYAQNFNCVNCNAVYYSSCKKFISAHMAFLTRNIRPFKAVSDVVAHRQPVWSKDVNKAKTAAFRNAVELNHEVKRLSISQVLTIAIANQEIEGDNFYIECTQKPFGDLEKVKGVLTSFVEELTLRGARVVIYVGNSMPTFNLEYHRL